MEYQRIRNLREDADKTQMEIAKMLGCDQSLYSKYERGEREIPLEIMKKLADYYGVSIDFLLERTDNPNVNRWIKASIRNCGHILFLL